MRTSPPRAAALVLAALAVAGCATVEPARPAEERAMKLSKAPDWPTVHGPATDDGEVLGRWLSAQLDDEGRPATVRLPVRIALDAIGGASREAHVVTRSGDGLALRLDDSALGISLADRTRQAFPGTAGGALWLEGQWRFDHFLVTRVGRPVESSGAPQYAERAMPGARAELIAVLEKLGSDVPLAERQDAAQALRAGGVDAIPLLIASLDDGRPFEVRDLANRMNLPPGAEVEPLLATTTVGARCEELLHAIITPVVPSPPAGNFKVFSGEVLHVDDWRAFWAKRRGLSLEALHAELLPYARAYWEHHGTTQRVP